MNTHTKAQTAPYRIELRKVSKQFGSTAALSDVSLSGRAGSIHALTGENGAGKSTLMKLLAGVYQPDAGELWMDGRQLRLGSPAAARRAGVSTVFQELTVLPNLSVAENLCLGREPRRFGMLDREAMRRAAGAVLHRVGIELDVDRLCGSLSIGEQQLLEIAKGVAADARVFIFDEPTAPLNRAEVDKLERLLRRLAADGKLIFYISHRLEEIFRFCDMATVLKDGKHVLTAPIATLSAESLVTLMVGRPLQSLFPPRATATAAAAAAATVAAVAGLPGLAGLPRNSASALDVRKLVARTGGPTVSFKLERGQIIGLAGLEGQGQRELLRALAGELAGAERDVVHQPVGGVASALAGGKGSGATVRQGVALIPEDRKGEGLFLEMSIHANLELGLLRELGLARMAPQAGRELEQLADRLQLRGARSSAVGALSGGNQQKVMLGRWLAAGVDTLLIEQPTRGVDVGAKAEIYRLLRQFTDAGGAVLAVSGDLLELIGLCDRILVMRQGAIVADVPAEGATEEQLLGLALVAA
ncbi:sugar ABC transporter ATP-binding protein [Oxalobacteraceae bacterium]|nr:sugar ABC transporter ATP-binding protein [Oxalobacteraceae bacterium]